jgi:hypothetical protein
MTGAAAPDRHHRGRHGQGTVTAVGRRGHSPLYGHRAVGLYRAAAQVRGAQVVGGWIVLATSEQVGMIDFGTTRERAAAAGDRGRPRRHPATAVSSTDRTVRRGEMTVDTASKAGNRSAITLLVPFAIGAAVSVGLGVYGRVHKPTLIAMSLPGFSSALTTKVWLASAASLFALVQLASALAMYGKLPGLTRAPRWVSPLHRWSGRIAFCSWSSRDDVLYALGFEPPRGCSSTRCWAASSSARSWRDAAAVAQSAPGWVLPVVGGLVLPPVGLWLGSSWYFDGRRAVLAAR